MSLCTPGLRYAYRVGTGHALLQTLFELSFGWIPWRLMFALDRDLRVSPALLCCRMNHREPLKNKHCVNVHALFTFQTTRMVQLHERLMMPRTQRRSAILE
jgi:hypothetical protein